MTTACWRCSPRWNGSTCWSAPPGAAKQARGLPAGRRAKLNATTRAGAAQRIGDGAIPEQVASEG